MSQALTQSYFHIVFSTKDRNPFIKTEIQNRLYPYLASLCQKQKCTPFEIGGVEDHVHLLVTLSKTIALSKLLEEVKSNSSRWMKTLGKDYEEFSWQKGYGAFGVDESTFEAVRRYIASQKEHHKVRGFKEEYLLLLKRYNVKYDEKYLWD